MGGWIDGYMKSQIASSGKITNEERKERSSRTGKSEVPEEREQLRRDEVNTRSVGKKCVCDGSSRSVQISAANYATTTTRHGGRTAVNLLDASTTTRALFREFCASSALLGSPHVRFQSTFALIVTQWRSFLRTQNTNRNQNRGVVTCIGWCNDWI
jgi:hypothetical protein